VAKITRKRLARGTKLMPTHVTGALDATASELESINIERDQMQAPTAPFRVNLTLPYLAHDTYPTGTWTVPIPLPPLQEDFGKQLVTTNVYSPKYSVTAPTMKLRSVSFSFGQRGEPAAIPSQFWDATGAETDNGKFGYSSERGKVTYEDVTRLSIRLSIHEKPQVFFGDTYPHKLRREIWSTVIPASALAGESLRANPFIQGGIDIVVDQYKTLVFTVSCPGLEDTEGNKRHLALVGIEASLKFTHDLVSRDSGATTVQNIPIDGGSGDDKSGAKTAPTVPITTPAAGTGIEADASDGVEYNIATIDNEFRAKLNGGYDVFGDVPPTEVIKHDASYEVFAVPLFQNAAHGGISAHPTFSATWPYIGTRSTPTAEVGLFDRRIIPIHHSYTIHHAILAWNWSPYRPLGWDGVNPPPIDPLEVGTEQQKAYAVAPSEDIGLQVGVGLGTGLAADDFTYDQIGHIQMTDPNDYASGSTTSTPPSGWGVGSTLIDRIRSSNAPPGFYVSEGGTLLVHSKWNWELHSIPLDPSGDAQQGYFDQGYPIFMGPGWTTTQSRQNLDAVAPATAGAEQWIEVRAVMYPTEAGKALSEAEYRFNGTQDISEFPSILVGYGGCYVYLICKKHLTR